MAAYVAVYGLQLATRKDVEFVKIYEVGGCIRDELLGLPVKDVDYTVETTSFEALHADLLAEGFEVFKTDDATYTIRAHFPRGMTHFAGRDIRRMTADFVYARKEGPYTDGRHPDWVEPGTLFDDLARRDFTVNAIARDADGTLIDPFDGRGDAKRGVLAAVGNAEQRLREDPLRILRALRFELTKALRADAELYNTIRYGAWVGEALARISIDRRREELKSMMKFDSSATMIQIVQRYPNLLSPLFHDGLWLEPTNKGK